MHIVFQLWLTGPGSNFFFFVLRENERRKSFRAPTTRRRRRKREFFPPFTALDRWNRKRKEERTKACLFPLPPPCCCCQEKGEGETNPTTSLLPYILSQGNSKYTFTLVSHHTKVAPRGPFYFFRSKNEALPLPTKKISFSERKRKTLLLPSNYLLLKPATPIFVFFFGLPPPQPLFSHRRPNVDFPDIFF